MISNLSKVENLIQGQGEILKRFFRLVKTPTPFLAIIAVVQLTGCGKSKESADLPPQPNIDEIVGEELETFLSKQTVTCLEPSLCPSAVAKVIGISRSGTKYCTGFLVAPDILLTSSTCLSEEIRTSDANCAQKVFAFFPATVGPNDIRSECGKVLSVAKNEGQEPALWRNDFAFIRLSRPVTRRPLVLSNKGLPEREIFSLWAAVANSKYDSVITKVACRPLYSSYLNPFATIPFAPTMTFMNCPLKEGSKGAPLISADGKVAAILHAGIPKALRDTLEGTETSFEMFGEMGFATNTACLNALSEGDKNDLPADCGLPIGQRELDLLRAQHLTTPFNLEASKKSVTNFIGAKKSFIRWELEFLTISRNHTEVKLRPSCFNPVEKWPSNQTGLRYSGKFSFEKISIVNKFNKWLQFESRVVTSESETEDYQIKFSPKSVRSSKQSDLTVKNGDTENTYKNVVTCSSLF